jgi:hypothetical protein
MTYTRTNLVPNPSATVNTTGWTVSGTSLTRDTTVSRSGGASFKIVTGFGGMDTPAGTAGIPVTPGVTYRFSFWAKGIDNSAQATFQNTWYDSAGVSISSGSPSYTPMNSAAWTQVAPPNPVGQYTAPANAAYLQLRIRTNSSGTTFWVDDIMVTPVEPGVEYPVYFDGDTPDTADETFSWTGTANASASTAAYTGRVNLLPNPSWELDASSWSNASRTTGSPAANVSGTAAGTISSTSLTAKQYAIPGVTYTASGWFTRGSGARDVAIGLRFYNAAGTELDPPTLTQTTLVTQDVPERRSTTRTAPAGTVGMSVAFSANNAVTGDAFLLEPSATLGTYFDGSTTAPSGYYAYWTGTPHNSSANLSVVPPPQRTNLFTHPSAEGVGITWTAALSDPVVTRTTDAALYGSESYKLTVVTGAANQEVVTPTGTSGFPVLAGNWYTLSASTGRSGTTSVRSLALKINWYTSAGAVISTTTGSSLGEGSGTSLVWTRNSVSGLAPVTAAYASVQLRWTTSLTAGEVHYFDGILFEQTPYYFGDYFDGSTTKTGFAHAWLGTAHASKSTQTGSTDPVVTFKRYESGAWVTRTAKSKAWNGSAWAPRRPKYWNGSAWVDLL